VYETILYERDNGVATLALNRPHKLNAFDGRMHEELHAALDDAAADDEIRCLVLRGEGRGFSAGASPRSPECFYRAARRTRSGGDSLP
jgi:2-(1,2-epoxy-1,2-dihydrophenyl)acetyl-CoA isomerase